MARAKLAMMMAAATFGACSLSFDAARDGSGPAGGDAGFDAALRDGLVEAEAVDARASEDSAPPASDAGSGADTGPAQACSADAECNDGIDCTTDRCADGRCRTLPDDEQCRADGPCTTGRCDATRGCVMLPLASGMACDDRNPCTNESSCDDSGHCAGVDSCPVGGDGCTVGECTAGGCRAMPAPDRSPCGAGGECCAGACSDVSTDPSNCGSCGSACTAERPMCVDSFCRSCVGASDCPPLACTGPGVCTSGLCVRTPADGWCLIGGACYADGAINPAHPCETCNATADPRRWSALAPFTRCDDGDWCTTLDACGFVFGCRGLPRSCTDDNPCTRDGCDSATSACTHELLPDRTTCGAAGEICCRGVCGPVDGCL